MTRLFQHMIGSMQVVENNMARIRCGWLKLAATAVFVLLCLGPMAFAQGSGLSLGHAIPMTSGSSQETTGIPIALPQAVAYDAAGNLYIADENGHVVLMVDTSGILSTVVGTGMQGFSGDGGTATAAQLDSPMGLAADANGNLYISDTHNQRIRKVSNGIITTIAGNGVAGFSGDGGSALQASLSLPGALTVDNADNIYFADTNNHRIRKIAAGNGFITTVAGDGEQGYLGDGGMATAASLDSPRGIATDAAGNIYFSDTHNHRVRQIDPQGMITTIAGNGGAAFAGDGGASSLAAVARPMGLGVDTQGNLYIADSNNQRIRVVSNGVIGTVVGNGDQGFSGDSGPATSAALDVPDAVTVNPSGELAITDTENQVVREASTGGSINTAAGSGPPNALTLQLSGSPSAVYGSGSITATLVNGSAPNGNVSLQVGGNVVASAPLNNSTASLTTATVGAGVHDLVASYAGDAQNAPTVSGLFVLSTSPASLAVTADSTTRAYGASNPAFTGELVGVLNSDGITATFGSAATISSPVGNFAITATLSDPNNRLLNYTVTATPGTLTISKAASAATLQTSATAVLLKNNVVLTATVTSSTTGTPTGTVNFVDGSTSLGSTPMDNTGTATLPISTLTAGSHSITTVYAGDSNFVGITSAPLSETVQDFQLSGTDNTDTVAPGGTASYTVEVTPTNGTTFPSAVSLAMTGLPPGATCTITPSSIAAGSGTAAVTVTVQTSRQTASNAHSLNEHSMNEPWTSLGSVEASVMVLGIIPPLPLLNRRRLRRTLRSRKKAITLLLLVLILLAALGMVGCGGATGGSSTQTYTMTLTGTGGTLQHSTTLTLTVQ